MPMMNFTAQGKATIIQFDKKAGEYKKIKKSVTPGDVFEVALEDMGAVTAKGIGFGAELVVWQHRQDLLKLDAEARDRHAMRMKTESERRKHMENRMAAIEARENGA